MALLWVSAVLLLAAACSARAPGRIVGGEPTTIERYPWITQVDSLGIWTGTWSQGCAANILTSRYVVSAAHCFDGWSYRPENRRIRAGATHRNTGGQIVYVTREFNHPSYGLLGADGDISVILLSSPLVYNPAVQPGSIIAQGYLLPDNAPVVHAGWGAISQGGPASPVLLDVNIYTVNNDLCRERYSNLPNMIVTSNMICAGLLDVGGKDACQGDSGGPLYFNDIIVGIVSWGEGCANATYPGVSTAVSPYSNWIVNTVES